jgi:hypothetical protein
MHQGTEQRVHVDPPILRGDSDAKQAVFRKNAMQLSSRLRQHCRFVQRPDFPARKPNALKRGPVRCGRFRRV